jgi:hypothetical protein
MSRLSMIIFTAKGTCNDLSSDSKMDNNPMQQNHLTCRAIFSLMRWEKKGGQCLF